MAIEDNNPIDNEEEIDVEEEATVTFEDPENEVEEEATEQFQLNLEMKSWGIEVPDVLDDLSGLKSNMELGIARAWTVKNQLDFMEVPIKIGAFEHQNAVPNTHKQYTMT